MSKHNTKIRCIWCPHRVNVERIAFQSSFWCQRENYETHRFFATERSTGFENTTIRVQFELVDWGTTERVGRHFRLSKLLVCSQDRDNFQNFSDFFHEDFEPSASTLVQESGREWETGIKSFRRKCSTLPSTACKEKANFVK